MSRSAYFFCLVFLISAGLGSSCVLLTPYPGDLPAAEVLDREGFFPPAESEERATGLPVVCEQVVLELEDAPGERILRPGHGFPITVRYSDLPQGKTVRGLGVEFHGGGYQSAVHWQLIPPQEDEDGNGVISGEYMLNDGACELMLNQCHHVRFFAYLIIESFGVTGASSALEGEVKVTCATCNHESCAPKSDTDMESDTDTEPVCTEWTQPESCALAGSLLFSPGQFCEDWEGDFNTFWGPQGALWTIVDYSTYQTGESLCDSILESYASCAPGCNPMEICDVT